MRKLIALMAVCLIPAAASACEWKVEVKNLGTNEVRYFEPGTRRTSIPIQDPLLTGKESLTAKVEKEKQGTILEVTYKASPHDTEFRGVSFHEYNGAKDRFFYTILKEEIPVFKISGQCE